MKSILAKAKKEIVELLKKASGFEEIKQEDLVLPPSPKLGDLSFPCFGLAKLIKKSAGEVAKELKDKIKPSGLIIRIEMAGSYLNFFLDQEKFAKGLFQELKSMAEKTSGGSNHRPSENFKNSYFCHSCESRNPVFKPFFNLSGFRVKRGMTVVGRSVGRKSRWSQGAAPFKKERIMMEFVSPNNNKPLHLGHLRNAFLGESVARLLESQGAKVIRACLFNDRGLHIAKSMLAYQRWGKEKTPQKIKVKGDKFVGDLYVEFEKQAKLDPKLIDEAEKIIVLWEKGDKKTRALWRKLNDWAMTGFKQTFKRLDTYLNPA